MPTVAVYNKEGARVGEIELSEAVFGQEVHATALYETVNMYLANQRQGTVATKTRGEVRGGGRKPWRQKGTGRARHGSIRSPLWVGGGTVFGPQPREYRYAVPKKVRRLALVSALSDKVKKGHLVVLDDLALPAPRTKEMSSLLDRIGIKGEKTLIVLPKQDRNVELSARNLPEVKTARADDLNAYEVMASQRLVMTREAVARVEEVWA
ncbi:MAG: 50S ribosomal protein L4 [Bacillota bacterium]|nr:50S ribosomal protein L4 [Bacillota bacterium]